MRSDQSRLSAALLARGIPETTTRRGWRAHGPQSDGRTFFVSSSGTLRLGPTISASEDITHTPLRHSLLREQPQ